MLFAITTTQYALAGIVAVVGLLLLVGGRLVPWSWFQVDPAEPDQEPVADEVVSVFTQKTIERVKRLDLLECACKIRDHFLLLGDETGWLDEKVYRLMDVPKFFTTDEMLARIPGRLSGTSDSPTEDTP